MVFVWFLAFVILGVWCGVFFVVVFKFIELPM